MKKTKIKMKEAHFGILYRWTTDAHTEDFIFVQEETLVNAKLTLILLYFFWLLQHSRTFLSSRSPTLAAPTSAGWQRAVPPQLSASVWADPLHFPEEIRLQPPLRTGPPFGSPCWPGCAHSAPILPPGFQARISSRPSPIPRPHPPPVSLTTVVKWRLPSCRMERVCCHVPDAVRRALGDNSALLPRVQNFSEWPSGDPHFRTEHPLQPDNL